MSAAQVAWEALSGLDVLKEEGLVELALVQ